MKRGCAIPRFVWLVILLMAGTVTAEDIRLANGKRLDDAKVKEITTEGMQLEMAGRTNLIPWRYLSAGTRFRFERPLLEKGGGADAAVSATDTNAPDKAASTNAAATAASDPKEKEAPKTSPAERLKQPVRKKK